MTDALNGKSLELIAAADPALAQKRENERLKKVVVVRRPVLDEWGDPIDPAYEQRQQRYQKPKFLWFD